MGLSLYFSCQCCPTAPHTAAVLKCVCGTGTPEPPEPQPGGKTMVLRSSRRWGGGSATCGALHVHSSTDWSDWPATTHSQLSSAHSPGIPRTCTLGASRGAATLSTEKKNTKCGYVPCLQHTGVSSATEIQQSLFLLQREGGTNRKPPTLTPGSPYTSTTKNMGAAASKPSERALGAETSAQKPQQRPTDVSVASCPLGFDKMGSTTTADKAAAAATSAGAAQPAPSSSSCPVKTFLLGSGAAGGLAAATPSTSDASVSSSSTSSSSCPVKQENRAKVAKYLHPHKYNVYSQRIDTNKDNSRGLLDPTNNMPANPNQELAPGQAKSLSTARVQSTIPKGGDENTWTYPSPQMFW